MKVKRSLIKMVKAYDISSFTCVQVICTEPWWCTCLDVRNNVLLLGTPLDVKVWQKSSEFWKPSAAGLTLTSENTKEILVLKHHHDLALLGDEDGLVVLLDLLTGQHLQQIIGEENAQVE